MAQSDYEVTCALQRATRTKDGAGGKTPVWANIDTGLTATLHHYSYQGLSREEQAAGGMASGPGVMTRQKVFFKFMSPFPAAAVNDRIRLTAALTLGSNTVYSAGTLFNVMFVREYSRTMQVDCELIS